jgi:putative membrane protein
MMWGWGPPGVFYGGFGWLPMVIVSLIFWALVVVAVIAVIRAWRHAGPRETGDPESPERILARRFARGEIDEEEYHRRLDALRRHA